MRRTGAILAMAAAIGAAMPAGAMAAGTMTVADFRTRAAALRAKGPMALFSSDIGVLRDEVKAAGKSWRAQAPAARPAVCPPDKAATNQDEVMAIMDAVPPAEQRRTTVEAAMIRALNVKFRCR